MMPRDFSNHLFRCSQLGKLMVGVKPNLTENQEKTLSDLEEKMRSGRITERQIQTYGDLLSKKNQKPELSASVKSYLSDAHKECFFGRSKELTNKYLTKGIQVEEKSITLYSNVTNKLFKKNQEHFSNDYIMGTPDMIIGKVIDIKSSWDFSTFPMHKKDVPTSDYEWQVQGYMELTGLKEAELVYCLVDTPFKLVEDELRRMDWKHNIFDISGDVRREMRDLVVEIISNLIYTKKGLEEFCHQSTAINDAWFTDFHEVPDELRVKTFKFQHDPNMISSLYEQIERSRTYLNELTMSISHKLELI